MSFWSGFGAVLVVLAEDGARFGPEVFLGVAEVHEAVGLELEDGLEVFLGEGHVVVRVVVGGVGVLAAPALVRIAWYFSGG